MATRLGEMSAFREKTRHLQMEHFNVPVWRYFNHNVRYFVNGNSAGIYARANVVVENLSASCTL